MLRFLKYLVFAPIALLLLIFAVANRHLVTVAFDPFQTGDIPAFAITAPLFLVLIATGALGVVAGAFATWIAQGRYRRASRQYRAEADKWRAEADRMRPPPAAPSALVRSN